MPITEVTTTQYECNGCGNKQYGSVGEQVFGIVGSFFVHNEAGGVYYEYWACSPKCHAKATKNALDPHGHPYG